MQILKGKSDRKGEVNQYVDYYNSSPQEINLDKWVAESKANKLAYESGKEPLDVLQSKLKDYYTSKVEWVCDNFPPNLAQYTYPELVIVGDEIAWDKDALYILLKQESEEGNNRFKRWIGNELLEYIGIDKEQQETFMIQNGWIWWDVLDYGLKKYHELDY